MMIYFFKHIYKKKIIQFIIVMTAEFSAAITHVESMRGLIFFGKS